MPDLILHVGFHKTGTTYLQRQVFPHLTGATYRERDEVRDDLRWLVRAPASEYDPQRAAEIGKKLSRGDETAFVSFELLSGRLWVDAAGTQFAAAERMTDLRPDAQILVTLRRQDKMLSAIYAQYVNEGGTLDPAKFVRAAERDDVYSIGRLCYHRIIDRYRELFGNDRVHVFAYEAMQAHGLDALNDAFTPLGVGVPDLPPTEGTRVNPSLDGLALTLLRVSNRWMRRSIISPKPLIPFVNIGQRGRGVMQRRGARLSKMGRRADPWNHLSDESLTAVRESNARLADTVPSIAEFGYLEI